MTKKLYIFAFVNSYYSSFYVAFNTGQFHLVAKTLFSILVINTIGINSFWSIVNACKVGQKKSTIQKSKKYMDIKEKFAYFSTLIKSQKL